MPVQQAVLNILQWTERGRRLNVSALVHRDLQERTIPSLWSRRSCSAPKHQVVKSWDRVIYQLVRLCSDSWRNFLQCSVRNRYLPYCLSSLLTIVALNPAWSFCSSFVQLKMAKENTYLHLGEWQWCQISTASSCQAPLYSKLKYDSPINTSLSWSFSPTALFQTSFEVCLPPLAEGCLCVWREKILSALSNYLVLSNPAGD